MSPDRCRFRGRFEVVNIMNIFQAAIDRTSPARRGLAAGVVVWCARCGHRCTANPRRNHRNRCVPEPASAPAAPTNPPAPSAWRFEIAPFLWMAGVDGSSTIGPLESSFEADFDDIVGDLDFGFMLHAEADKGPWTILFDGMALDLGAEGQGLGGGDIDSDVEMVIIDLGVAYQFLDLPLGGSNDAPTNGPRLGLQVLGGARYTHLGIEVEPAILASRESPMPTSSIPMSAAAPNCS